MFSAAIMIIFFGIGAGLQSLVLNQVSNSDLRDVITVQPRDAEQLPIDQVMISRLKSVSGVTNIEQSAAVVGRLMYRGISLDLPLYGVSTSYFDLVTTNVRSGELHGTFSPDSENIVLSTAALSVFGISPADAIGKTIKVGAQVPSSLASKQTVLTKDHELRVYKIAAVIDKDTAAAAYIQLDGLTAVGIDRASEVKLRTSDIEKVPTVRDSVSRLGFQTSSILDAIDQVDRIFGLIQRILLFFGIASLVVTVFGTFNTITLTLIEETAQVGFLRIMGMQRGDVRFLFVSQSIILTGVGAVAGIAIGFFIGGMLNALVRSLVSDSALGNDVYIFQIPYGQTIIILMLSIILGWVVGVMPAKRAVTINPLEALHT
jgi:ABC-type lipoprotein release transport system permease subunit